MDTFTGFNVLECGLRHSAARAIWRADSSRSDTGTFAASGIHMPSSTGFNVLNSDGEALPRRLVAVSCSFRRWALSQTQTARHTAPTARHRRNGFPTFFIVSVPVRSVFKAGTTAALPLARYFTAPLMPSLERREGCSRERPRPRSPARKIPFQAVPRTDCSVRLITWLLENRRQRNPFPCSLGEGNRINVHVLRLWLHAKDALPLFQTLPCARDLSTLTGWGLRFQGVREQHSLHSNSLREGRRAPGTGLWSGIGR